MKRLFVLMAFISLALLSCEKDKDAGSLPTGFYSGTFQRVNDSSTGPLSQVNITFNANLFFGTSQFDTYPAICNGKYTIEGDVITFENTCVWPANFDWTLILDGEYKFTVNGDNLELVKSYNGTVRQEDRYKLVRKP